MASRSTPRYTCANDRKGLAHLCGYGSRPPFSQERLSKLPDGRLAYQLKRPLADGRPMLLLQPSELLRRLATLVPPPRAHLVRYRGVFAPASRWRKQVIRFCPIAQQLHSPAPPHRGYPKTSHRGPPPGYREAPAPSGPITHFRGPRAQRVIYSVFEVL